MTLAISAFDEPVTMKTLSIAGDLPRAAQRACVTDRTEELRREHSSCVMLLALAATDVRLAPSYRSTTDMTLHPPFASRRRAGRPLKRRDTMRRSPKELGGPERAGKAMQVLEEYGGACPSFRRAHGRGIGLRGHFIATPEAAALTTAEHMQGHRVETVVRLSNSASSPHAADRKAVLGFAVRFELASGDHSAWASLTIDRAPMRVPDDFIALTTAQRPGKNGKPNQLRVLAHMVTHPWTVPGLLAALRQPTTQSFARSSFHGLHAYYLVDDEGRRRAFRYRWVPSEEAAGLTIEQQRAYPPQYLVSELEKRLSEKPVSWNLIFQMAEAGDRTDDVTKQWRDDRRQIVAGTLVIDGLHEDPELVEELVFDPTKVPPGIELSDDPILHFRSEAYTESHRRRKSERTAPVTSATDIPSPLP